MNGMELARQYFEAFGRPLLTEQFPELRARAAAGLVGEGSQCFGFDDEFSRDHDWGPGFLIWLTDEDYEAYGAALQKAMDELPKEFLGYRVQIETPEWKNRCRVWTISEFYAHFLGKIPKSEREWLSLPEAYLAVATNGQVFEDPLGEFTKIRERLLTGCPEDVRIKKMAARAAEISREGQYNYPRCINRGDTVAAELMLSDTMKSMMRLAYLLNRRHAPFEKWLYRGLLELPRCAWLMRELNLLAASADPAEKQQLIEEICRGFVAAFHAQGLTDHDSDFLQDHIPQLYGRIRSEELKKLHVLVG